MKPEHKVEIALIISGAIALISIVVGLTIYNIHHDNVQQKRYSVCVNSGGRFIKDECFPN